MSLAAFYRDLRCRWLALTHSLWPETPGERAERERAGLAEELHRRELGLLRRRRRVEQLRAELRRQERAADRLAAEVQGRAGQADRESAWSAALSLDRLRQAAAQTRARLERQEAAYERQRVRFEQAKWRQAELRLPDLAVGHRWA